MSEVITAEPAAQVAVKQSHELPTELGLLVLLLGNVSLQDGVRLMDVALPTRLAAALPGPPPAAWFRRERAIPPASRAPFPRI